MLKNEHGIIKIKLENDGEKEPVKILDIRQCILASGEFLDDTSIEQIDSAVIGMIRMEIINGKIPSYKALNHFIPISENDYEKLIATEWKNNVIEWKIDISVKSLANRFWSVGVN